MDIDTSDNAQKTDAVLGTDPMFKVMAVFETPADADRAIDAVTAAHFDSADIELFCGEPGAEEFDFTGEGHGILARMVRAFRNSTYDRVLLKRYEASLRSGNCLVLVRIHKTERKEVAAQIMHDSGALEVDYFGLAMTEHISDKS